MAAGRPVVSTTVGARGLSYQTGHDICIADDGEAFADLTIHLLSDRDARHHIGANARQLVLDHYDWATIGTSLTGAYTQTSAAR